MTEIRITITIKDDTFQVMTAHDHKGRVGQVKAYNEASDLLPEIERMLADIEKLDFPDIETSKDDTIWQPLSSKQTATKARRTKSSSKKKSAKKEKPAIKPPFTLEQGGKPRTLLMTDDFDIQLECKDNKNFKFGKLDDAKRIAQALATQDTTEIIINDKSGKSVETIKPSEKKEDVS